VKRPAALLGVLVLLAAGTAAFPAPAPGHPTEEEPAAGTDPDYAAGKAALDARQWETAIRFLSSAALRDTRSADLQNYLGYAYRKSGRLDLAFKHYERALALDPRHRGAHEYIGEAHLLAGDLPGAERHLAALEKICLIPCEEHDELKQAIAEFRRRASR
jgi:Flp pilus assembly protein TadD